MPQPCPEASFTQLRERLLRAGIAPRHVCRYLSELTDHLADLTAEEQTRGLSPEAAHAAALTRLGDTKTLAATMISQPRLRSLSARIPWAVFGLVPLLSLAVLWTVSLFLLWFGWQHFLPGAVSPFDHRPGPHNLFETSNIYFQLDRALFFGAPVLIGWTAALIAARQRRNPAWPATGLFLIATLSSTSNVYAVHHNVTGSIHLSCSAGSFTVLVRILIALCILMLPYLAERLRNHHPPRTNR